MITLKNIIKDKPYRIFQEYYFQAKKQKQPNIEAIAISSLNKNKNKNEVDSRMVNLKYIINNEWIFFSNYNSKKAKQFIEHNQISAILYWPSINLQIRMKAKIKRTTDEFNQNYFFNRSEEKNALAISSNQSKIIHSFNTVQENFEKSLKNDDLKECPKYWGGYSFTPYEIEFWEGNKFRLNKRNLYIKDNANWNHFILEP
jgi:pyridoxamine 5'-phosphate oxidase